MYVGEQSGLFCLDPSEPSDPSDNLISPSPSPSTPASASDDVRVLTLALQERPGEEGESPKLVWKDLEGNMLFDFATKTKSKNKYKNKNKNKNKKSSKNKGKNENQEKADSESESSTPVHAASSIVNRTISSPAAAPQTNVHVHAYGYAETTPMSCRELDVCGQYALATTGDVVQFVKDHHPNRLSDLAHVTIFARTYIYASLVFY